MAPRKKAKVEEVLQESTEVRGEVEATDAIPEVVEIIESTTPSINKLRTYVNTRLDFQRMRIRMNNRMGIKANGKAMNLDCKREIIESKEFKNISESAEKLEDE